MDEYWVGVRNTHAEKVPPFGLMRPAGGGVVDPVTNLLPVTRPDIDSDAGLLVNGETTILPGGVGKATWALRCRVAADRAGGAAPAVWDEWGSAAGSWLLARGKSGWRCVAAGDSESGEFVRVNRSGRQVTKGKLVGALAAGGSTTLNVWEYNGATEAATGEVLTVYDWVLPAGGAVAAGANVFALLVGPRWYVIPPAGSGGAVEKGVLSAGLVYQGSALCRLWHDVAGTETDTGVDVTVWDWLLLPGQAIGSGRNVTLQQVAGKWYVNGWQCA